MSWQSASFSVCISTWRDSSSTKSATVGSARSCAHQALTQRDLSLDHDRRVAVVRGEPVELTKQEFDLLYLLAARPGIVFSRAALLQNVWSEDTYVTERTV